MVKLQALNGNPPRTLYIGESKHGDIWKPLEWKKIMAGYVKKGYPRLTSTILKVFNSSTTSIPKTFTISAIAFSKELGEIPSEGLDGANHFLLALADQRGNIYILNFINNRFWLLARTGISVSCLTFNSLKRREVLVGLSDHTIQCYNVDTFQLIAKLPAIHQIPPNMISVHPKKQLALSTASTEAILWDTEKWERKRLLEGFDGQGLQQAHFSPDGMMICASFDDGSIYFWTLEFALVWKISLAQMSVPQSELSMMMTTQFSISRQSYFDMSTCGEFLASIGISSRVYIWNLFEKRLLHEILIPSFENQFIVQCQFLGSTNILAILSDGGDLIFIDVMNGTFKSQLKSKYAFEQFSVSPNGRWLGVVLKEAKFSVSLIRLDPILDPREEVPEGVPSLEEMANPPLVEQPPSQTVKKKVSQPPRTFFDLIESKQESSFFNRAKIRGFLNHYGSYPEQFRPLIWRFLLKLPENRGSYEALLDQGTHPSFRDFRVKYPLKSDRAAKSMERILSCLASWSPIFEDLEYLPSLVFPFVKLFWNDLFSCLEVVMTVLMNWCQKWWEYYPNPPIELLEMLSQLLSYHDPELFSHLTKYKATAQVFGWTLMQSLFSELFSKKDWLVVWDHLVSNSPSFLYHFIVAYLVHFRKPLLNTTELKDFYYFFQRRNATNVTNIILCAYNIKSKTPSSLDPSSFLKPFIPLTRGEYPIFNQYPQFIVNYSSRMKSKIRQEELDYIKKRQLAGELARLTEELQKEKQHWDQADAKMNETIDKWWKSQAKTGQLAKAIGTPKSVADKKLEKEFELLENEWEKRKEEMVQTRKEIAEIRERRGQKVVDEIMERDGAKSNSSIKASHGRSAASSKANAAGHTDPSPTKSEAYPSVEFSSIKLSKTTDPSHISNDRKQLNDPSLIKMSFGKNEPSPIKSETNPSAELTSIKLEKTLQHPSPIQSYERISNISPVKFSPTKSESPTRSVHFDLNK